MGYGVSPQIKPTTSFNRRAFFYNVSPMEEKVVNLNFSMEYFINFIDRERWNSFINLYERLQKLKKEIGKEKFNQMLMSSLYKSAFYDLNRHGLDSNDNARLTKKEIKSRLKKVKRTFRALLGMEDEVFNIVKINGAYHNIALRDNPQMNKYMIFLRDTLLNKNYNSSCIIRTKDGSFTAITNPFILWNYLYQAYYSITVNTNEDFDVIKKELVWNFLKLFYSQVFHLFIDGNGRAGRAHMNLNLLAREIPPFVLEDKDRDRYLEEIYKAHKYFDENLRKHWVYLTQSRLPQDEINRKVSDLVFKYGNYPELRNFFSFLLDKIIEEGENILNQEITF